MHDGRFAHPRLPAELRRQHDLARRDRVAYSVTPGTQDRPYEVDHSSAVYVFDASGAARLLIASLSRSNPDIDGIRDDLNRLALEDDRSGFFTSLWRFI